ncbi:hypothetical protein BC739_004449 [Kutzneria viridogrisea]|uniref:Uncharacterized protein n=2 Tax=Kutzneria TaxID=43356 RepID=W5W2I7_9PSEU|nr:hypothetical protein [Kutzneria albida]AHH95398.1 hypothetical protein KALB_2029 [Kutzneria albida DSM 43870]MBA8927243.1 hypothetical protein [Kutzneria viridogrisea]
MGRGRGESWTGWYPPLVERYITGAEFSVEAVTHAGTHHVVAVTEKLTTEVSRVEIGHVVPARNR